MNKALSKFQVIFMLLQLQFRKDQFIKLRSNFNPVCAGPKGLPLIGCVHQLGKLPFKQFNKWSQEFGDIYNVKLAGKL